MDNINASGSLKAYNKINSIEYPVYCYINTDASSTPDGISSILDQEGGTEIYNDILNLFSSFEIKGTNENISYEVQMSNKSENSLKQIFDLIIELAKKNNPDLMFM